jgi:hypothetical protein
MDTKQADRQAVARLTPEAKLQVLSGMIQQAWVLKEAWLRVRDPDASAEEIRQRARSLVGGRTS